MATHNADVWVLTETHESLSPGDNFEHFDSDPRPTDARQIDDKSHWVTIWVSKKFEAHPLEVKFDSERTVACEIETSVRKLTVFGTVLPWYNDERSFSGEVNGQCKKDWTRLLEERGAPLCVAGDFNVSVSEHHYYGSRVSRGALQKCLEDSNLTLLTDFEATKGSFPEHGLIDHIAISKEFATPIGAIEVIQRRNSNDHPLSDHCGVVVQLSF